MALCGKGKSYLRALGEEGSDNLGLMRLELPTEISLRHLGGHSNHLLVTKRELRQRPDILWIAVNNSSSTSGQVGMKPVPKPLQLHS
jgi:hypothetical protein